jgi:hypothetical protein
LGNRQIRNACTATAPARNKISTQTAKSTPYLFCHRDNFSAKISGPVAGWLRQVTSLHGKLAPRYHALGVTIRSALFIAGPLCVRFELSRPEIG